MVQSVKNSGGRSRLLTILLIVFLSLMGFGIVIPVLPHLVLEYKVSPVAVGVLFSTYSFFQFIGAPTLGQLSDRYGRRPILIISLLGSAVGYLIMALSRSVWLFFLSRAIDGLTGGNISVAQAYIADITTKGKQRTKAMGLIGMAFAIGLIIGPALGGLLGKFSLSFPFWFAGILAIIGVYSVAKYLPEPPKRHKYKKHNPILAFSQTYKILSAKNILSALISLSFITSLLFASLETVMPLFAKLIVNWDTLHLGLYFSALGIILGLTQAVVLPMLLKILNEHQLLVLSLMGLGISFILYILSTSNLVIFTAGFVLATSYGILTAVLSSLISTNTKEKQQGLILGINQSMSSLGRIAGPIIGGLLYGVHHYLPFITAAITFIVIATKTWFKEYKLHTTYS